MMMKQWLLGSLVLSGLAGCQAVQIPVMPSPQLTGQIITVTGQYMQWSGGCVGTPPRSRHDWMLIHPEYGCVYVYGAAPFAKKGQTITIQGVWQQADTGQRYIERR
jgi:hypothetical protein